MGGARKDFVGNKVGCTRRYETARFYPKSAILLWEGFLGAALDPENAVNDVLAVGPQGHATWYIVLSFDDCHELCSGNCLNWSAYGA